MRVAILGLGQVGKSLLRLLTSGSIYHKERHGVNIEIAVAADFHHMLASDLPMDPERLLYYKEKGDIWGTGYPEVEKDALFDQEFEVLIDLMPATGDGLRARDLYTSAFDRGKNVVTACKSGLANHWKEVMDSRTKRHKEILYEATVAGGLPFFSFMNYCTRSSEVVGISGIVNSSANFILKRAAEGIEFEKSLADAKSRGILETDYHFDTLGYDSAWKTAIIANSLFGQAFTAKDVDFEGVEEIVKDGRPNRSMRLVSSVMKEGSRVTASSRIVELDKKDPLLNLGETGLGFTASFSNRTPLSVAETFDGPVETANGVLNDLLLLA